jgi:hypothetical protein
MVRLQGRGEAGAGRGKRGREGSGFTVQERGAKPWEKRVRGAIGASLFMSHMGATRVAGFRVV